MVYVIVKLWAKLAMLIYFNKITIRGFKQIPKNQSFIIASTHPNSFLDAIVLGALLFRSVNFLARGDAFKNQIIAKILAQLQMIPIFRISEGKESLTDNNETFVRCKSILEHKGGILIFAEGICVNEWKIRPLKKGTFRIANSVSTTSVVPCTLSYSSFSKVPKQLNIQFGVPETAEGKTVQEFNSHIMKELQKGQLQSNQIATARGIKWLFALPAFFGFISQYWLYYFLRKLVYAKTKNSVFFDSVLFGVLMFVYPVFVLIITCLAYWLTENILSILILPVLPLLTLCYSRYRA